MKQFAHLFSKIISEGRILSMVGHQVAKGGCT